LRNRSTVDCQDAERRRFASLRRSKSSLATVFVEPFRRCCEDICLDTVVARTGRVCPVGIDATPCSTAQPLSKAVPSQCKPHADFTPGRFQNGDTSAKRCRPLLDARKDAVTLGEPPETSGNVHSRLTACREEACARRGPAWQSQEWRAGMSSGRVCRASRRLAANSTFPWGGFLELRKNSYAVSPRAGTAFAPHSQTRPYGRRRSPP